MPNKEIEEVMEEKKYPSVILGLDISTACVGASVIFDDGIGEPQIKCITHIVPKIPKSKTGIEALILRKEIFERDFLNGIKELNITECVIESPITHAMSGNSNAHTVAQLLQFNGLLSEAVYRVLGIVPTYITSFDARMASFPQLLSVRKFNKKGEQYDVKHLLKSINDNHCVLFGSYPFDCDKKTIMMDLVSEKYPDIEWVMASNGTMKKENYDACDSLVCALAYSNIKRFGEINPVISEHSITDKDDSTEVSYTISVWDKEYKKTIVVKS